MFNTYFAFEKQRIGNICEVKITIRPGLFAKLKGVVPRTDVYRGDGTEWYDHPSGKRAGKDAQEIATKVWASDDIELSE